MRDNQKNKSSIDQVFKDQFDQAKVPFDPVAWEMLAKNKKNKKGIILSSSLSNISKNVVLIVLLSILGFVWLTKNERSIEQEKTETKNSLNTSANKIEENTKSIQPTLLPDHQKLIIEDKTKIRTESSQLVQLNENKIQKANLKSLGRGSIEENKILNASNNNYSHGSERTNIIYSQFIESKNSNINNRSKDINDLFENRNKSESKKLKLSSQKSLVHYITEKSLNEENKPVPSQIFRDFLHIDKLLLLDLSKLKIDDNIIVIEPIHMLPPQFQAQNITYAEMQFNLYVGDFSDGSLDLRPFPISLGYRWIDTRSVYSNLFLKYDYTQTDEEFSTLKVNQDFSFALQSEYTEKMISANTSIGYRLGSRFFVEGHAGVGLSSLSKGITLRVGEFQNPKITYTKGPDFDPFLRISYGLTLGVKLFNDDVQIFGSVFQSAAIKGTLTNDQIIYPQLSEYECDSCYKDFGSIYNQTRDIFKITFGIRKTIF